MISVQLTQYTYSKKNKFGRIRKLFGADGRLVNMSEANICRSLSASTPKKRRLLSSKDSKCYLKAERLLSLGVKQKSKSQGLAIFWCTLRDSNSQPLVP